ncbi:MAG TPA: LrgB family protein [Modicisalibacter sp.]|nr:LrgB family protein [Modicisalibacter sp.]
MADIALRWQSLPAHLADTPLLSTALTLLAFMLGARLFQAIRQPGWCPPILIASSLLALLIWVLPIGYQDYYQGAAWLMLLLGPATVALGVPLYQQFHHIRALWRPVLITLPPAAMLAAAYSVALAWWLGASPNVVASLAPKSVTAPIALGITEQIGGSASLMMGGLLITGVVATLAISLLAPRLGVTDERVIGFTLGINGHAIGTVRAFEISATAGAFASLGMGLTGIFTAIFLPIAWQSIVA